MDVLRLLAAQAIVAHHFAAYGPVADTIARSAPSLIDTLYHHARLAVQVFFVISGYLAARAIMPSVEQANNTAPLPFPWREILRRHLHLSLPMMADLQQTTSWETTARPCFCFIFLWPCWAMRFSVAGGAHRGGHPGSLADVGGQHDGGPHLFFRAVEQPMTHRSSRWLKPRAGVQTLGIPNPHRS